MALGDQSSRPPTKGAAHYRHAKAAQQRGDDVTDVRVKRRNLLEAHRAKMAAKRGTRAERSRTSPRPRRATSQDERCGPAGVRHVFPSALRDFRMIPP